MPFASGTALKTRKGSIGHLAILGEAERKLLLWLEWTARCAEGSEDGDGAAVTGAAGFAVAHGWSVYGSEQLE